MKQNKLVFFITLFVTGICFSVPALEIGLQGSLGNMAFDTNRDTALGDASLPFKENLNWQGTATVEQAIADNATFSILFNRDPVLRNGLYTTIAYDTGYAKITVGPFFGLFNSPSLLISSGLSTTLTMTLPGLIYGTFRSDTTIGAGISVPGDYVQQQSKIALGIWGPNTLTSFILSNKTFTYKKTASLTTVDSLTNYDWVTEVFKKNVPYTATVSLGYQSLKRSYIGGSSSSDELAAFMIGFDASFKLSDSFKLSGGGKAPLYAWGLGNLKSPGSTTILYEASLGMAIIVDTIRIPKRKAAPAIEIPTDTPQNSEGNGEADPAIQDTIVN